MKKLIIFVLTVVTVISMTIPAHAATPTLKVPEVPQISKIDFKVTVGEDFWDNYFKEHPINWGSIMDAPTSGKLSRWKG